MVANVVMVVAITPALSLEAMEAWLTSALQVISCNFDSQMNPGHFVVLKDYFQRAATFYSFSCDSWSFVILLACHLGYYLKKAC